MKLRVLVGLVLAVTGPSVLADGRLRDLASYQALLPVDAPQCTGHVSAAPVAGGGVGPHINWRAIGVDRTVEELVAIFRSEMAATPQVKPDGCVEWRSGAKLETVLAICPVGLPSPWRSCNYPNAKVRAVVLFSEMVGAG